MPSKAIQNPIRAARLAAGFDGAEGIQRLAKIVGRKPSWIQSVEAGYRPPEYSATKLARAINCDPKLFLAVTPRYPGISKGRAFTRPLARRIDPSTRNGRPEGVPILPCSPQGAGASSLPEGSVLRLDSPGKAA